MTEARQPTERDRYWLDHEEAVAASGLSAKAYVAEQGLSLHAFYQARKRLRSLGLLPASNRRQRKPKSTGFSKVELVTPRKPGSEFRLVLPNGLALEWSGAELPPPVVDLLERLIPLR